MEIKILKIQKIQKGGPIFLMLLISQRPNIGNWVLYCLDGDNSCLKNSDQIKAKL